MTENGNMDKKQVGKPQFHGYSNGLWAKAQAKIRNFREVAFLY